MVEDEGKALGALLGLAVGDALGTTLEFKRPGTFEPLTDMVGGGPFGLAAGEWTDDTSMALCLAESLIERGEFEATDQTTRYLRWFREGHLSVNGRCFDIGITTRQALLAFEASGDPFSGSSDPDSAGNGSLMRLAPVVLAYAHDPVTAVRLSGQSSRTTHGAATCIDACRYFAALLVGALSGLPKDQLVEPTFEPYPGAWDDEPLTAAVAKIAAGSFKERQPPDIRGTGYVVDTLEAALWAFASSDDFDSGALAVVNLGEDADTTGAVYGQIAGAYYGAEGIRPQWRERVAKHDLIASFAAQLAALQPAGD